MPYKDLEVFKKAYEAALEVHKASLGFPKVELGSAAEGFEQVHPGQSGRRNGQAGVRQGCRPVYPDGVGLLR